MNEFFTVSVTGQGGWRGWLAKQFGPWIYVDVDGTGARLDLGDRAKLAINGTECRVVVFHSTRFPWNSFTAVNVKTGGHIAVVMSNVPGRVSVNVLNPPTTG